MRKLLKNNIWIAGVVLGAAGGYLYWEYFGCMSGTCSITSKPINSMAYFGMAGGLLFSILQPKKKFPANNVPDKENGIK